MPKSKAAPSEHVYSFTTTEEDNYLPRVIEEAGEDTDFIITTERSTVFGRGTTAVVLVHNRVLLFGTLFPNLPLAGKTLGDWLEHGVEVAEKSRAAGEPVISYTGVVIEGDVDILAKELENVRGQIRRIKNIITGRTVRTTVESF